MKMMKLSSLGTLRNGMNYDKSSAVCGCKIIGVADFGNRVFPDYDSLSEIDSSIVTKDDLLQNGDIVFVRSNGNKNLVGRTMFIHDIKDPVCYSGFCIAFRPNTDLVYPEYLFYVLRAPFCKKQYGYSQQTNITNLSQGVLGDVDVPVPDLDTQQKLAKILSEIDLKIISNTRICVELEAMAKTLYDYWFTQFDFPNAEGKPYCSSGGEMVWNDQLKREIPKGWDVRPLSHVISSINTGLNPRDNFILGNGDIQYLTVKNLTTSGTIDFSGCDTVDEQAREIIHKRSDVSVGDILFASIAPLGRCYLIQNPPEKWDINESVFSIRRNASRVTSEFLYMYFISDTFIKAATSSSTGSIFKGIRINTLLDIAAVIPPKDIVTAFTTQVKTLLALKEQKGTENRELTKLRDWLLPMLMNGQATVE